METTICKCGKSKVSFDIVGEDLWHANLDNCKKERDKKAGEERYVCNECGEIIDRSDYYMMVDWS